MKSYSAAFVVIAAAVLTSTAAAQNLQYNGLARPDALTASVSVNGGAFSTLYAGSLKFTDGTETLYTYCADPLATLNSSFNTYSAGLVDLSGSGSMSLAGKILATNYFNASSADEQAGLQLAIWSALLDGGPAFDANGANFKVNNVNANALNFASNYFSSAVDPGDVLVTLYSSSANGAQSQLTASPVPEPFTMGILGAAGIGIALRRRRQQKA